MNYHNTLFAKITLLLVLYCIHMPTFGFTYNIPCTALFNVMMLITMHRNTNNPLPFTFVLSLLFDALDTSILGLSYLKYFIARTVLQRLYKSFNMQKIIVSVCSFIYTFVLIELVYRSARSLYNYHYSYHEYVEYLFYSIICYFTIGIVSLYANNNKCLKLSI